MERDPKTDLRVTLRCSVTRQACSYHRPRKTSAEPPVTTAQPLWRLVKDGHVAEARVRPIEGVGVELRFEWNGQLAISQVFRAWEELEAAAAEKRRDLEARG